MPLLAVWSQSALSVSSKETARKSRNLAADGRCVITTDTGDLHLILEGMATRVRDEATASRSRLPVGASIAEAVRSQQLTGG